MVRSQPNHEDRLDLKQTTKEPDSNRAMACAVPDLRPDDRLFAELANLAQVSSAEGLEKLRKAVLLILKWQSRSMLPHKPPPSSKKRALAQLRKSIKLSRDLSAIVSSLDQQALHALRDVYLRCRSKFGDLGHFEIPDWPLPNVISQITEFAELSSEALVVARTPRKRGRPHSGILSKFSKELRSLSEFTLALLFAVRAGGGRLTLDKNTGTGTLVEALALLRPHVRPGLIPNNLPFSTLARVKALDQKIATALGLTENIRS
jgi:hypothetical protein